MIRRHEVIEFSEVIKFFHFTYFAAAASLHTGNFAGTVNRGYFADEVRNFRV